MPAWQNTKFKRVFKWRYMAESTQGGFRVLQNFKSGALDAVIQFNDGYKGCVEVFKKLQITPGYFTLKAYKNLDINRINDAERHSTPNVKQRRKILRATRKKKINVLESKEGVIYKSGAF
ncbi:hypothetical protein TNCV_3781681 [Trichonephila clavipes]|nr:hypothetical protein TNCV_3781681 [Trichonephila clavipes]